MSNLVQMGHLEILLQIKDAVKERKLSQELIDYLTVKPKEIKAKVWDKELAYFLKVMGGAGECHELPKSIQDALVARIIRAPCSVNSFAAYLRNEFFSSRHLAQIRANDKTYSYLKWYSYTLQEALLFWQRLEDERNRNPFSQLVPDMEKFAAKYLTYHPVMEGFIGEIFKKAQGDKVEMSIISQEVSTLISWSSQKFALTDVKSVIEFCDTMDFLCYVKKFGLSTDEQAELVFSGKKDKIFAYIDEVGVFDEEVLYLLNSDESKADILVYYEENSVEPCY